MLHWIYLHICPLATGQLAGQLPFHSTTLNAHHYHDFYAARAWYAFPYRSHSLIYIGHKYICNIVSKYEAWHECVAHRSMVSNAYKVDCFDCLSDLFAIWLLLLLAEHTPSPQVLPFPLFRPLRFDGTLLSRMCHVALVPIAILSLKTKKYMG